MLVTKKAPDFNATMVNEEGNIVKNVSLADLMLNYNGLVLFFYPRDFSPICPTEIRDFNNYINKFKEKKYNVVGVSCDSEFVHQVWRKASKEIGGIGSINFSLLSDSTREISKKFDVLFNDSISLRATFIIDNNFIIRHQLINDIHLMRNIEDTLKVVEALEFYKENGDVCPIKH